MNLLLGTDAFLADDFDADAFLKEQEAKCAEYEAKIKAYYLY